MSHKDAMKIAYIHYETKGRIKCTRLTDGGRNISYSLIMRSPATLACDDVSAENHSPLMTVIRSRK